MAKSLQRSPHETDCSSALVAMNDEVRRGAHAAPVGVEVRMRVAVEAVEEQIGDLGAVECIGRQADVVHDDERHLTQRMSRASRTTERV